MTVGDLRMTSSLKSLLKQAHLDSYPWATAPVQGLFLWKSLHGLWSPSGYIHLLHYGLHHRLHVDICSAWCPIGCRRNSTLCLQQLLPSFWPDHGVWVAVCLHSFSFVYPSCFCTEVIVEFFFSCLSPFTEAQLALFIGSALARGRSFLEPAGKEFLICGSFWALLIEAKPATLILSK